MTSYLEKHPIDLNRHFLHINNIVNIVKIYVMVNIVKTCRTKYSHLIDMFCKWRNVYSAFITKEK